MYKEVWQKLQEARHIVLATHINPDADTIGSALGLYHVLQKSGKRPSLFNSDKELPYNLDFLPGIERFGTSIADNAELLVSLDCGSFDRLGIDKFDGFIINIDHHRSNEFFGDLNLVEPSFGATAQVVFELLERNGAKPCKNSATALYTGIVDDTGFFKYESVNEKLFRSVAKLCGYGASPHYVAKMLTMREPLSKIRLIQMLLADLKLYLNGRVGVIELTREILKKTGAKKEMADDALHMVRSLATVEVAVLLREEDDGKIKVSLRSKDRVDVSKIAIKFGGGGHKNAAGFTIGGTFDEVLEMILNELKRELDETAQ